MEHANEQALEGKFPGEQTNQSQPTHVIGYSDASGWDDSVCASIGLITGVPQAFDAVRQSMKAIGVDSEFKWETVRTHSKAQVASRALKCMVSLAQEEYLRVDTIIWNQASHRMGYQGHDDMKVLMDMYSQLVSTVLFYRWPSTLSLTHYADQHNGPNWSTIDDATRRRWQRKSDKTGPRHSVDIRPIEQVDSKLNRMVQISDLFAGLARFSYTDYDHAKVPLGSHPLPGFMDDHIGPSKATVQRCGVLSGFIRECNKRKLGVSLNPTKRGLVTQPTNRPVSFWFYEPQHPEDIGAKHNDGRAY